MLRLKISKLVIKNLKANTEKKYTKLFTIQLRNLEIALEQSGLDSKRLREQIDVKAHEMENYLVQKTSIDRDLRRCKDDLE